MNWLVYALLSAFFAALVAIFGKIGVKGVDPVVATAVRSVFILTFSFLMLLGTGKSLAVDKKSLFYIALSGLAGALSWVFYFAALKHGKVSQVVPIDRSSLVIAVVLAATFMGEKITLKTAAGILLTFIGLLLISL